MSDKHVLADIENQITENEKGAYKKYINAILLKIR